MKKFIRVLVLLIVLGSMQMVNLYAAPDDVGGMALNNDGTIFADYYNSTGEERILITGDGDIEESGWMELQKEIDLDNFSLYGAWDPNSTDNRSITIVIQPDSGKTITLYGTSSYGTGMFEDFKGGIEFHDGVELNTSATDLSKMFKGATKFYGTTDKNQDISDWNTSNVTNMREMFHGAEKFNQSINTDGSKWNTSNVTNMASMFEDAKNFNGNIGGWDTGNVTTMESMFSGAKSFNRDISNWDFSSVKYQNSTGNRGFHSMFKGATAMKNIDLTNGRDSVSATASDNWARVDSLIDSIKPDTIKLNKVKSTGLLLNARYEIKIKQDSGVITTDIKDSGYQMPIEEDKEYTFTKLLPKKITFKLINGSGGVLYNGTDSDPSNKVSITVKDVPNVGTTPTVFQHNTDPSDATALKGEYSLYKDKYQYEISYNDNEYNKTGIIEKAYFNNTDDATLTVELDGNEKVIDFIISPTAANDATITIKKYNADGTLDNSNIGRDPSDNKYHLEHGTKYKYTIHKDKYDDVVANKIIGNDENINVTLSPRTFTANDIVINILPQTELVHNKKFSDCGLPSDITLTGLDFVYVSGSDPNNMINDPGTSGVGKDKKIDFQMNRNNVLSGRTATLNYKVVSSNYQDANFQVKINVTSVPNIPYTVISNTITKTYDGDVICSDNASLTNTYLSEYINVTSGAGTLSLANGVSWSDMIDAGEYHKNVLVKPNNPAQYNQVEVPITIKINKANVTGEPTWTKLSSGVVSDADLSYGTLSPSGGNLYWENPTVSIQSGQSYRWYYDKANYNRKTGLADLYVAPSSSSSGTSSHHSGSHSSSSSKKSSSSKAAGESLRGSGGRAIKKIEEVSSTLTADENSRIVDKNIERMDNIQNPVVAKYTIKRTANDLKELAGVNQSTIKERKKVDRSMLKILEADRKLMSLVTREIDKLELLKDLSSSLKQHYNDGDQLSKEEIQIAKSIVGLSNEILKDIGRVRSNPSHVKVINDRVYINNTVEQIGKTASKVQATKKEIDKVVSDNLESGLDNAIVTDVTLSLPEALKKSKKTGIRLNKKIFDELSKNNIDELALELGIVSFEMDRKFIDAQETRNIEFRVDREKALLKNDTNIPQNATVIGAPVVELGAIQGKVRKDDFNRPLDVVFHLDAFKSQMDKNVNFVDEIAIYRQMSDGTWKAVGGVYDPVTNTLSTKRMHLSKYTILKTDKNYSKIEDSWAKNEIASLQGKGVIKDDIFASKQNVTREEFAGWISNAYGLDSKNLESELSDLDPSSPYYEAVTAAYEQGIISGKSDGKFDPEATVSRQEMAVMIATAINEYDNPVDTDNFELAQFEEDLPQWAVKSVETTIENGNLNQEFFGSNDAVSKEEAANILYNMYR